MSKDDKKKFVDETMERLGAFLEGKLSDEDHEKVVKWMRERLIQSFKNGIEVGTKRAHKDAKKKKPSVEETDDLLD